MPSAYTCRTELVHAHLHDGEALTLVQHAYGGRVSSALLGPQKRGQLPAVRFLCSNSRHLSARHGMIRCSPMVGASQGIQHQADRRTMPR